MWNLIYIDRQLDTVNEDLNEKNLADEVRQGIQQLKPGKAEIP